MSAIINWSLKPMVERSPKKLPLNELTAITTIDGRYRDKTEPLAHYVSEYAVIKTRMEVEGQYLVSLSDVGVVRSLTSQERRRLQTLGPTLTLPQARRVKTIEDETHHDVKAMERTFRELLAGTSLEDVTEEVHLALTSEDDNNLTYRMLMARARDDVVLPAVDADIDILCDWGDRYRTSRMLGRTHGQGAIPTLLGKEMLNFAVRMNEQARKLEAFKLKGKLNGAIGNFSAHRFVMPTINWVEFSKKFVSDLGFEPNLFTTQINPYEDVIEMFQNIQRLNSVFLDFDQDMWRYISDDWIVQTPKAGEVGSSTMPQKVNPINFENSEGNVVMSNAVLEGLSRKLPVSRLQRDLSDSTAVRNFGLAMAFGLVGYKSTFEGMSRVSANESLMLARLNDNWSILTEGVQTYLRRAGVKDPYSMVALLSRGQKIGADEWRTWVDQLPVNEEQKETMRGMTPETYVGYAEELTDMALDEIRSSRTKRPRKANP